MGLSSKTLIVGIAPYFLERGIVWFEKNVQKILKARQTQSFWQDNTLLIEKNQKYPLMEFLRKLDELGYEKVQTIEKLGEFSHRGNIIDIFPVNSKQAIRLEFLGNKIEIIEPLEIFVEDEESSKKLLKKKLRLQREFSDLKNLKPGDYLVHLDHGIGKFLRIEKFQVSSFKFQEYYVLEYAQNDKLCIPLGLERKLSRYIGFVEPILHRLGSQVWQKTKRRIKEEAEKFAKELLAIYAQREIVTRSPYLSDEEIQTQFKSTFQYEETPDQLEAIEDIKGDMKREEPMDRIICGDVGFGKTEVALRAMIKAVISGRQAAMICPTTILANQHFQNFKERLKNLPIQIALLSRLQSKREQKEVIKGLKEGEIDIVIGTHRLLSKDVEFKNLGLLVIDDEQRFGVRQKEKFKKLRTSLDILSLSATPIPRTLYMTLSSLKDISLIQTPPLGRLPIKTFIYLWKKEEIIKKAIENEISRGGQVYFLYNRVETIGKAKEFLEKLLPKVRFGIAHGRLKEKELVKVMENFQNGKVDVLVATTIIENGLDFPNVNTLIVADVTRLGLSQAYQIRGRIGRSNIQAFAYFLYPSRLSLKAKERLKALKESEELGSGYKIALKDLELRGAGNILGREQSGHINQVGLNLYCQMIAEAIEKMKKSQNP